MQLDNRAQTLLKALIERYIADGQPVGSRALSKISGLDVSPATIRNIMADLEEMGFVASPHTSAGRIPTARGYRIFVDTLLTVQQIDESALESQMQCHLQSTSPQKLISSAAQVLSSLSQFAGIVMTPRRESVFRQIEFLRLSEKRILLVIVSPTGDVQNRLLLTEADYTPSQLVQASNYLNQHFAGKSLDEVRTHLQHELRQLRDDMTSLMQAALEAGSDAMSESAEDVVISGERNLLSVADLSSNMASLRKLFDLFEQKTSLMQLLDMSSKATGVQIFIGGESQLVPMEEMSVVTAPYEVNGRIVGTLGVIGPTRMAYAFYWPVKDKVVGEPVLPEERIGAAGSGKELRIGESGREDARRVLGDSVLWSADGRYGVDEYTVTTGYWVWPLCAYAGPDQTERFLQLRFGSDGKLEGFDVFNDWWWATKDTGIKAPVYNGRPATRPATTRAWTKG